jgi:diguanylate cyclase (GGDEF)-like protein
VALDTATLVATIVVVLSVLAGLLALTWVQNRGVGALGIWAVCFILCAAAAALFGARARLPEFVAIDVANAMRLLAFGLGWHAARLFARRKGSCALAFAPAILWLAASRLSVFDVEGSSLRVAVASLLIGAYAIAIAAELWGDSRWRTARPAAILLALHGGFFLARSGANVFSAHPRLSLDVEIGASFHPVVIFEAMVVAVALAFLLVSAAKEQLEMQHREAALIDPLTGVANRRGFDAVVAQMLARARREKSSAALLLLDLDHFKAVNDTWGHQVGDHVLQEVARAMEKELRRGDVVARLGGEEFAVALAGCGADQAALLAEGLRRAVAALDIRRGDASVGLTVSVGVAALRRADTLESLFARGDAALYRAKAAGRNLVELASPPA